MTGVASPADAVLERVDAVVMDAVRASADWRRTPAAERAACLRHAAAAVRRAADELGDALTMTTGRLLAESRASALTAADLFDEASVTGLAGHRSLAAGNTVVHKPSEHTSGPGAALAEIVQKCFPSGVLEIVDGDATVGRHLTSHPAISVVAHVGSTAAGREIRAVCGARGAKAVVENGGKDPVVVDDGVDPAWAASQVAMGAFTNAGQLCTGIERVYVHESVATPFLHCLVREAEALRAGDPRDPATTLCRLVHEDQLAIVASHVDEALADGARLLTGGTRLDRAGPWFAPTVLAGCHDHLRIMNTETFGPVAPAAVVSSWDEGLARAATGSYGLAASVLTSNTAHAVEAIDTLDVGTVKVNAVFGGAPQGSAEPRGDSGSGCGFGPALLDEFTALKAGHWEASPGHPH